MPTIEIPTFVTLQNGSWFLRNTQFFAEQGEEVVVVLPPRWAHIEPFGLAMLAAWGRRLRRMNVPVRVENLGPAADYAWRMHLFEHLGVEYAPPRQEREEAGRFLPVTQVRDGKGIREVIGAISALLHLQDNQESLYAVQHSVSELLRNVIEHSGSPDGAFVCAQNYSLAKPARVTIAVADCGLGIRQHLGRKYQEVSQSDENAITLAMRPGVTGAIAGIYGGTENAGAGLFITRSIAKGSGGYFLLLSGQAGYRLRRARNDEEQTILHLESTADRHDMWHIGNTWQGTVVSMEIRTDKIADYEEYIAWIRKFVPEREGVTRKIRFT